MKDHLWVHMGQELAGSKERSGKRIQSDLHNRKMLD